MCGGTHPDCKCLEILHKRTTRYSEDEQAPTQNYPTVGGTWNESIEQPTLEKPEPAWAPTNEQLDAALNGRNPPSRISAKPGKSGSSEVYVGKGLSILKSGYGRVSKEELAQAERWEQTMSEARVERASYLPTTVPVTRSSLKLEETLEEVKRVCPECSEISPGQVCTCELGAVDSRLLTPAPRK